jgi:hypothetical protein
MQALSSVKKRFSGHRNIPYRVNLAAWYRNKIGIINVNGACSQWQDQSGNMRHLLQATAANRPTIGSGGAIRFNGTDQSMAATFTLAQPLTIYLAFRQVSWTSGDVIFDGVTGTVKVSQATGTPGLTANAGSSLSNSTTIPVSQQLGVLCFVANGANSVYQSAGGAQAVTITGDAGANSAGGITLGCDRSSANFANIAVREMAVYSVAHDANTRLQIMRYMGRIADVGGI